MKIKPIDKENEDNHNKNPNSKEEDLEEELVSALEEINKFRKSIIKLK